MLRLPKRISALNCSTSNWLVITLAILLSPLTAYAGILSDPTAHGTKLVFVSEGDLWQTKVSGGIATRLTSHRELESNPALSPDGRYIAFNARYDGANEVYLMPSQGGEPRQMTFEGGGVTVRGWTPSGDIMFTSSNHPGTRPRVLRTVDIESGKVNTLPLLDANLGTFTVDSRSLYFTRFGLSLSADNAVLYRGGRMSQLWRYGLGTDAEAVRLLDDFEAPIRAPMGGDQQIYFVSDKSGSDNIWSVSVNGGEPRQLTSFEGWQIKGPSLHDGRIYFQSGADLLTYDLAANATNTLQISLASDHDYKRVRWLETPLDFLESSHVGGNGEAVVLTARGNAAITFPGQQRRVELAIPDLARARGAKLGSKGEWVYLILDQNQFGEIWRFPADGSDSPQQLTRDTQAHIWQIQVSPDGRSLIFDDKLGRLWQVDLRSFEKTLLEQSTSGEDSAYGDFSWSPASQYVAYSTYDERGIGRVVIRDLNTKQRHLVTHGKYESRAPTFSRDGNWLFLISDRHFDAQPGSPWGDRNTGSTFDKRGKLYALQLARKASFPFAPINELEAEEDGSTSDEESTSNNANGNSQVPAEDMPIEFEGIEQRLWALPVASGNYRRLRASNKFLYVLDQVGDKSALNSIKIDREHPKVTTLAENVETFELSDDATSLFFRQADDKSKMFIVPATDKTPDDIGRHTLRVDDWRLAIDPTTEWRQMFLDAWRLHRDFAFDTKLRGVDWDAVRAKYLPLVDRIGHRHELNDLLGQMIAELGVLHSQIGSGDQPKDEESGAYSGLGAEFSQVKQGLEITQIYVGERALQDQLGPLLQPGIDTREGDILIAVNGRKIERISSLYAALQHQANQEVRLDFQRKRQPYSAIVKPITRSKENELRYRHMVESNRQLVRRETDDQIGYLHLYAMGGSDMASFTRDFYEHADKDAMVIDVRGNRGGNIDSLIISALLRQVWAFWESELGGQPSRNMQQAFRGHLVILINEGTYSDGETFAAGVKALKLASLIGTRTAGAGIWLSDRNRLADRGIARIGEFAQSGLDGRWLIEGRGVSPDIEVINAPYAAFNGKDAQLETALDYLRDKLIHEPIPKLKAKPLPPLGEYGEDAN